jgi:hypothetical protein
MPAHGEPDGARARQAALHGNFLCFSAHVPGCKEPAVFAHARYVCAAEIDLGPLIGYPRLVAADSGRSVLGHPAIVEGKFREIRT